MTGWIPNFSQRLRQLEKVAQAGSFTGLSVWLGGLFFPEAYVTATRQAVAHRMSWSLETLDLRLDLEQEGDPAAFAVEGMTTNLFNCNWLIHFISGLILEGSTWKDDHLLVSDGDSIALGRGQIRWVLASDQSDKASLPLVNLPVYLNSDRSDVLFTVNLPFATNDASMSVVRAICLTAGGSSS